MDKLTPPQRHNNMSAIRGKNTKPEPLQDEQLDKVSRGMSPFEVPYPPGIPDQPEPTGFRP